MFTFENFEKALRGQTPKNDNEIDSYLSIAISITSECLVNTSNLVMRLDGICPIEIGVSGV